MTEVKFSGAATVVGFPRDKAFGFEVEGERLIVKAGKEVFLTIEKEPAQADTAPPIVLYPNIPQAAANHIVAPAPAAEVVQRPFIPQPVVSEETQGATPVQETEQKSRKPRGPNVQIDGGAIIAIDPARPNPYSKLRGKYYETLKTAQGRTVSWWAETSMVKSLEGSPITMLKFFLSEGVLQLQAVAQSAPVQNVAPIQPGFGQGQPMQQAQVAGPLWSPQTPGQPGGQTGGATFM